MASAPQTTTVAPTAPEILPAATTLLQAARISLKEDKPIMLDYYVDSVSNKAWIGLDKESGEKMLVKSNEEYTSQISKSYKVGDDFLVMTENSLYIVSAKIQVRKIQSQNFKME